MAARCGICLKTTSNKKERLRFVTVDGEAKIQFGYYSLNQRDLNRSLLHTKVHEKCYQKYFDRWYNQSVRNMKGTNAPRDFEHEIMSITNENNTFDGHRSPNTWNIENHDDDDGDETNGNVDGTCDFFCSKTIITNQSVIRKNKPALIDISNVDYSTRSTISFSETDEFFPTADLLVQEINNENNDIYRNSLVQDNIDCEYNDIFSENRTIDHDVLSVEKVHIGRDTNTIQGADGREPTVTSDHLEGESSFFNSSEICTSIDHQTNTARSRSRSMYQTSTPKVTSNKIKITTRRRRRSEEGVILATGTNDRSLIYDSPLHELEAWLSSILRDGRLIPLIDVQQHYQQIIKGYNLHEHHSHSDIRCDILRKQLESKFPDQYHFETVSKRDGTYIALNNISLYSRAAISLSKSSTLDSCHRQQPTTFFPKSSNEDQVNECEVIFNAVRLLRNRMKETLHVLETFFKKPETMTELTNDLFADCILLVIRNFIGSLTLSNRQFKKFETNHDYYEFFNKDLFQNSSKSLKNTVIGHDILNMTILYHLNIYC